MYVLIFAYKCTFSFEGWFMVIVVNVYTYNKDVYIQIGLN